MLTVKKDSKEEDLQGGVRGLGVLITSISGVQMMCLKRWGIIGV
jgi:hypothetical protein